MWRLRESEQGRSSHWRRRSRLRSRVAGKQQIGVRMGGGIREGEKAKKAAMEAEEWRVCEGIEREINGVW